MQAKRGGGDMQRTLETTLVAAWWGAGWALNKLRGQGRPSGLSDACVSAGVGKVTVTYRPSTNSVYNVWKPIHHYTAGCG